MEKYFPKDKIVITGNPVRELIIGMESSKAEGKRHFGLSNAKPVIFVTGGSLGAGAINNAIANDIEKYIACGYQLIWQTGANYFEALQSLNQHSELRLMPFIKEMDKAYAAADLIVSRAGGTISELCIVGKPCILLPSPNVTEDHQTHNAMNLVDKQAAIMVKDKDANDILFTEVKRIIEDEKLAQQLSENIKKMAITNAAERIAKEALALVHKN
ncbi:UNVERIFIED_CONTAM: hypothetical protein GTU68_021616 [Idotea baltica]|nr:hypothetical protein [Idotea baltica]